MKRMIMINLEDYVFTLKTLVTQIPFSYKCANKEEVDFLKAIEAVAESVLLERLRWMKKREKASINECLDAMIVDALGLKVDKKHEDDLLTYIDDAISEHLYSSLARQITESLHGMETHYWEMKRMGKSLMFKSGGIMIDLDRLDRKEGLIEIDLEEHWDENNIKPPTEDSE